MANLRTTIVIFLSIIAAIASADVLSEQQISQIAKMYNSKSEGLYTCKSVGRTIVFIFETVPENDVTKEQIIDYFSKEQAANMAVNAINVEYDFTIYGKI